MLKIHNVALGQAGIHRVASELIIRGFSPFMPAFDVEGVDLMTKEGVRIQVKTTRLAQYAKEKSPSYHFELRSTTWIGSGKMQRTNRDFAKECDFVILWGVDEDRFWVVPSRILTAKSSIRIHGRGRLFDVNVEELKKFRAEGLTYREIAEKYGFSTQVIWDRLHGNADPQHGKIVKAVRECETQWSLIQSFVDSVKHPEVPAREPLQVNEKEFLKP